MRKKAKLTKMSLDELAQKMPIIHKEQQKTYIGGGRGTQNNPYSFDEYARMSQSGSWNGGFVINENFHFQRDNTGNWIASSDSSVYYIPKERPIWIDPVTVEGNRQFPSGSLIGSGALMYSWENGYNIEDGSGYFHAELNQYADSESNYGYLHVASGGTPHNDSLPSVIGKYEFVKFNNNHTACLKLSQQILGIPTNAPILKKLHMATVNPDLTLGRGINIEKGEKLIFDELKAGRGIIAGVHYNDSNHINEGITDHFIVIMAMEKRVIDGTERTVYRYYDTRTSLESHGTSRENYLYRKGDKLVGVYRYGLKGTHLHYTVTQLRTY